MSRHGRDYILAVVILLAIWEVGALWAGPNVLADPLTVMRKLYGEAHLVSFWRHVGASVFRIFAALCIAFVTAVPVGLALGSNPAADRAMKPLIYLTYPVPKIVFMPLILLVFGLGDAGKIAMLSIILFFQLLIATRDAAHSVNKAAKHSLFSLGGTKRHLFLHVIWPASLPAIFTALRVATGTVVAVLFFVESIAAQHGIGFYILEAWGRGDIPQVFVGILVLALIGVVLYEIFDILERVFCKWNRL